MPRPFDVRRARTQRERIWRACLIQRRFTAPELSAATGISRPTISYILRELQKVGAICRVGNGHQAISIDPRLPIADPERSLGRRVYDQIDRAATSTAVELAAALGITGPQAQHALRRLALAGHLQRVSRGRYALTPTSEDVCDSITSTILEARERCRVSRRDQAPRIEAVLQLVRRNGQAHSSARAVSHELGLSVRQACAALARLASRGLIERAGRGIYFSRADSEQEVRDDA